MSVDAQTWHKVELSGDAVIVVDHDGKEYRMVLYRRRKPNDRGGVLTAEYFDDLVRRDILPRGYYDRWMRFYVKHVNLGLGLAQLIEAAKTTHDPYAIKAYIRGTHWGRNMP